MSPHLFVYVNLFAWQTWLIVLVGCGSALLITRVIALYIRKPAIVTPPPARQVMHSDPFMFGSATDRRTSLRRAGQQVRVLVSPPQDHSAKIEAWVVDRSVGGLCLWANEALSQGSIVSLQVAENKGPDTPPWIDVEVRSCRAQDEGWEIGCQFLQTPPWSVLLMFG